MNEIKKLCSNMKALAIFRSILDDAVISAFVSMLENISSETVGEFVSRLYHHTDNFTEYLVKMLTYDENDYLILHAQMAEIPQCINEAAHAELKILERASQISPDDIRRSSDYDGYIAPWSNSEKDFVALYAERIVNLSTKGYGIYSEYHAFRLENDKIVPVKNADTQTLEQLSGYEAERKKVIDNTAALISGKPAANILLYGDAGTGKSSTVKAVVNEFKSQGLRLIELKKSQLRKMPLVFDEVAKNPLKFIIFIDDLSFASDDDDFGELKAVLEGSVASGTSNTVIYATSNRRHLVKETFSGREGDDIHRRDSMEETISLSERFGLKVNFSKPDKFLYIKIVEQLADEKDVEYDKDKLAVQAEAYALRRSGRSGRAAKQFIDLVISGQIEVK